jgi:hypothetical protein
MAAKTASLAIDLTGSQDLISEIAALAKNHSTVEDVSEPTRLDADRALNFGLPGVGPKEVLEFLTVLFAAGKALFEFLKAVRDYLRKKKGKKLAVSDASGKFLGQVDGDTSDEELARIAGA